MAVGEKEKDEYGDFSLLYTVGPSGARMPATATWTNSLTLALKAAIISRKQWPRAKISLHVRASERRGV